MAKKKAKKKGRRGVRVTLALDPRAHHAFVSAGGGEGKSSYISAVLRQREHQWKRALAALRADGDPSGAWSNEAIVHHIEQSEYVWQMGDIAVHNADAMITGDEHTALLALCAEWYAGNDALEHELGV